MTPAPRALAVLALLVTGVAHAGLERAPQQPAAPRESGLQRLPPGMAPPRADEGAPSPQPQPRGEEQAPTGKFQVPRIQGHVTDLAGVLSEDERAELEARLAELRRQSGYEVAIFVPTSLQGETVEDVAYETFQTWKLGQAEPDNGVLLLVAPKERELRIETGKGVGGELTDLQSSRIIRDVMTPRLRNGDWFGALTGGADGIARALTGQPLPEVPGQARRPDGVGGGGPQVDGGSSLTCILFAIFALFMFTRFFGGPRGGRRRRGGIIFFPPIFGGGWRGGGGGFGGRGGGGGGGFGGGGGGESGGGGASGRW